MVLLIVAFVVLPGNPDPINVPATLAWRFRLVSLGGAAAYWSVLAVVFGWLCLRVSASRVVVPGLQTSPLRVPPA